MRNIIITVAVIILIAIGAYFFLSDRDAADYTAPMDETEVTEVEDGEDTTMEDDALGQEERGDQTVIGSSVGEHEITAYHYGNGETELLFVGGIHGGYEWNTVLLSYQLMDYLESNPSVVPEDVTVTVIPVLNPDGLNEVVGTTGRFSAADVPSGEGATIPGRFNANNVDLNRNFDCDWQETGTWQNRSVSGGSAAFSEPESQAVRDYVQAHTPDAAVVFYSAAGGVFASNCHGGILPETTEITNIYADASDYKAYEEFDFYQITGDMVNWLASIDVPAISVLLTDHKNTEWTKNRAGVEALLNYYGQQ